MKKDAGTSASSYFQKRHRRHMKSGQHSVLRVDEEEHEDLAVTRDRWVGQLEWTHPMLGGDVRPSIRHS